jgi:hypothetical protein
MAVSMPALSSLSAQDTVRIRGREASCATCRIVLARKTTLRVPNDAPGLVSPYTFAQDSRGRILFNDPFGTLGIRVFSADGQYVTTVGKRGQGPGEFMFVAGITFGPDDTLHVFGNAHWVFDRSGRPVRTTSMPDNLLPRAVLEVENRRVFNGTVSTPAAYGQPYHLVDASGTVVRSFGLQAKETVRGQWSTLRVLANNGTAAFLAGHVNSYSIEEWGTDGRLRRIVRREVDWYPDWTNWDSNPARTRPPPRLMAMSVDALGRLWTVSLVADAAWRPAPPVSGEGRMATAGEMTELFDTIVEVIDLRRGTLLATQRFPQMMLAMPAPGVLVANSEDDKGEVVVDIWRVSMSNSR